VSWDFCINVNICTCTQMSKWQLKYYFMILWGPESSNCTSCRLLSYSIWLQSSDAKSYFVRLAQIYFPGWTSVLPLGLYREHKDIPSPTNTDENIAGNFLYARSDRPETNPFLRWWLSWKINYLQSMENMKVSYILVTAVICPCVDLFRNPDRELNSPITEKM
jgi:hypothetical protein